MIKIKEVLKKQLSGNESLVLALCFLILQALVAYRNVYSNDYLSFFQICGIAPLIVAYGFWRENYQLVKGMISLGLIGQMAFFLNLIAFSTTGITFVDATYLFNYLVFFRIVSLVLHLTLLISLVFNYRVRPERKSLMYSAGFIIAFYILTLFLTPQSSNLNFVYSIFFIGPSVYYTVLWPLLTFLIVVLPTYYLQLKLYDIYQKKKTQNPRTTGRS